MEKSDFGKYFEKNRQIWNDRVDIHMRSELYDIQSFLNGKSSLTEVEKDALGDVRGKTLLHLQCHFGLDTLSWARMGAIVTGIDFSEKAIQRARQISQETGIPARFVESNIYDLPVVLEDSFDIVFTSFGAIPWLPDLGQWASIVNRYLKKGGIFYLAEFHPALYMFDFNTRKIGYGYFTEKVPYEEFVTGSYADPEGLTSGTEYFWNHSISEVVKPLLERGLSLLDLCEYDFSPYSCFPDMKELQPGRHYWASDTGVRIPHVFSIKMQKD